MNWDPFQREVLAELGHVLYGSAAPAVDAIARDLPMAGPAKSACSPDAGMLARLGRAARVPVDALPAALHDPALLARLRGDGPAKRALWPTLRALRPRPQ